MPADEDVKGTTMGGTGAATDGAAAGSRTVDGAVGHSPPDDAARARGAEPDWRVRVPALPVLGFLVAGILPIGLPAMQGVAVVPALIAAGLLLAACLWLFAGWRRWGWLPFALGLATAGLHSWAPWRTYPAALPAAEAYVEVRGVIVDDRLSTLPDFAAPPDAGVRLRLEELRLHDGAPWQAVRGTVQLRGAPEDLRLAYGDRLAVTGALRLPWDAALPGAFDYRRYLARQGVLHNLFAVDVTRLDDRPRGRDRLGAALLTARDGTLRRLLSGVATAEDRAVLAAMFLGYREGMERDQRELYIQSGMVHIFAVSGLHVGVFFALVMGTLLVARVPFGARHYLAPALVLGYVLLTGAAPSALRAWLMLTIWSVGRGRHLVVIPVNAVLTAAVVLLLRPWNLFDTGFQYSFLIVLALLFGWQRTRALLAWSFERDQWRLGFRPWYRYQWRRLQRAAAAAALAMVAAWLGGLALTARTNGLFLPLGFLTNLALGLLVWPLFLVGITKITLTLLLPIALLDTLLGGLLSLGVGAIRGLASLGADHGGVTRIAQPALWIVLLWSPTLYAALAAPWRSRRHGLAWALLAALLLAMVARPPAAGLPAITLLQPPGDDPPMLLLRPPAHPERPVLIGLGSRYSLDAIRALLQRHGVHRLDTLLLLDNTTRFAGGAPELLAVWPADRVLVLAESRYLLDELETATLNGGGRWYCQVTSTRAAPSAKASPPRDTAPGSPPTPPPPPALPADWRAAKTETGPARSFRLHLRLAPGRWLAVDLDDTPSRGRDLHLRLVTSPSDNLAPRLPGPPASTPNSEYRPPDRDGSTLPSPTPHPIASRHLPFRDDHLVEPLLTAWPSDLVP